VSYLLDTNVVSELRKRERCDPHVSTWYSTTAGAAKFLSVLTIGEIRRGIEGIRRRDTSSARALDVWLAKLLADYSARIPTVNQPIADEWGRLNVPDPLPVIDGLLAATTEELEWVDQGIVVEVVPGSGFIHEQAGGLVEAQAGEVDGCVSRRRSRA